MAFSNYYLQKKFQEAVNNITDILNECDDKYLAIYSISKNNEILKYVNLNENDSSDEIVNNIIVAMAQNDVSIEDATAYLEGWGQDLMQGAERFGKQALGINSASKWNEFIQKMPDQSYVVLQDGVKLAKINNKLMYNNEIVRNTESLSQMLSGQQIPKRYQSIGEKSFYRQFNNLNPDDVQPGKDRQWRHPRLWAPGRRRGVAS